MSLLNRDVCGRSRGNFLKVIRGGIVLQRFRVVPEGFDRFHCVNGQKK